MIVLHSALVCVLLNAQRVAAEAVLGLVKVAVWADVAAVAVLVQITAQAALEVVLADVVTPALLARRNAVVVVLADVVTNVRAVALALGAIQGVQVVRAAVRLAALAD